MPSSSGLKTTYCNFHLSPDQFQQNLLKHQNQWSWWSWPWLLCLLTPIQCCMNTDYWVRGTRQCRKSPPCYRIMTLPQHWYGWMVAELLSRVEHSGWYVQAVVMHVIWVSQRECHERCMTPHSSQGLAHKNTYTQGHRYMCREIHTQKACEEASYRFRGQLIADHSCFDAVFCWHC